MAKSSHKRDTNARRKPAVAYIAAPIAAVATLASVGVGVLSSSPDAGEIMSASQSNSAALSNAANRVREPEISRSDSRANDKLITSSATFGRQSDSAATAAAVANADTELWTTEDLDLWNSPLEDADNLGLIDAEKKVIATGREDNGRTEIVLDGKSRWVTSDYLDDEKPEPEPESIPVSAREDSGGEAEASGECTNGTSVESGVSPNVVAVHQAVCAAFPEITTYGTFRGDGEHAQGIAVDIMVSGDRGWEVAEFIKARQAELGVSYLIYSQQIWSVERGSEGWRGMEDRGSSTANHYDHVHVTTY